MGYFYDHESRVFYPRESSTDGEENEGGVRWLTHYAVVCGGEGPWDPSGDMCVPIDCEAGGERGVIAQVYRRLSDADPWEPWPGRQWECRTFGSGGEPIPLSDVEAEIVALLEEHFAQVARPEITVAPSANAVVNLPVLASTPDAGDVGFDIENPLPGHVEASPAYAWAWSNGEVSEGPGRPYDGTNPAVSPGHYPVRSIYTSSGTGEVQLTATWTIVLSVEGIPPITDIEPLVYTAGASFAVRSAETVLVDGAGATMGP